MNNNNDDFVIERDEEETSSLKKDEGETLKKIKEELSLCKKEKSEYLDGWQRTLADFANYKEEEKKKGAFIAQIITENTLAEIIPAIDNFLLAMNNKEAWNKVDENWRRGVEYIYKGFMDVMENHKLESFGKIGEDFNPEIHTALARIGVDREEDEGKIIEVLKPGWKSKDRILRPAEVKVGEHKKED